jgi:antitoxin HicB
MRKSCCCTVSSRNSSERRKTNWIWRRNVKNNICKIYEQKNTSWSDFRDFLKEQGILGEVEARALKQALSLQISRLLEEKSVTKAEMAARMKTSRAAVDRLLDASNSSVTLNTLGKAARALGRKG